jgi:dolichyl-phosphate beta-glucosyltransferase
MTGVLSSLIMPAFNESQRLPLFLEALRAYCDKAWPSYEVLVVDDGSQDCTVHVVMEQMREWHQLQLLRHTSNMGKGAAVRTGVLAA